MARHALARSPARERAATRALIFTFLIGLLMAAGFLSLIAFSTRMAADRPTFAVTVHPVA
ncbi:hypothetical protein GCM10007276_07850 [Agaricicola taiwanensis]|uniref:Uncharacterized protein n=1 Tax=Agaricicola taiwanensis TaxID=591372 RepID=A0A8J2YD74_9RHOB|nr:hypothetical protein [Agaricicola taiwanensis]GGE33014.1 hypothetical protein GCM10007276_07850 [Agaricicola taiwanensis]